MVKLYRPIVKLGEAEIRALENAPKFVIDNIEPIIEITRGRKRSSSKTYDNEEVYPFNNRLDKIKHIFKGRNVSFDLTSDETLTNNQILSLYNPNNGYSNWIEFLCDLKKENIFNKITPCLIINGNDDNFAENLESQAKSLLSYFGKFIYRNSLIDENCYEDIEILKDYIENITYLIDCDYVIQAQRKNVIDKVCSRIENLSKMTNNKLNTFIVSATSFPKNISEIGDDVADNFRLCEVDIYDNVSEKYKNLHIEYSDYASINPIRNDTIIMARGWIPRIDVPLQDCIYYIRQRRPKGISSYASTYCDVARQIVNTPRFPNLRNWGIAQIINCSQGATPSSSPSFWISVRMCIHLEQQINRIYST